MSPGRTVKHKEAGALASHLHALENHRGRFLRITEEVTSKRNSIIIPAAALNEFMKLIDEMVKASEEIPAKTSNEEAVGLENGPTLSA